MVGHVEQVQEQYVAITIVVLAMLHDVSREPLSRDRRLDRAIVRLVGRPVFSRSGLGLRDVLGLEAVVETVAARAAGDLPERCGNLVRGNVVLVEGAAALARESLPHVGSLLAQIGCSQKSAWSNIAHMTQEQASAPAVATTQEPKQVPWYFEKTGPALFNEWSLTHLGWVALFQLLFPDRRLTSLVLHTIYESIEGYIFPLEFRDSSMRNHVGDTIAFAAGMLAIPSPSDRSPTDMVRLLSEARGRK